MATPRTSPRELARALAAGNTTVEALAKTVGVDPDRVKIVLKALHGRGLVRDDPAGGWVLTEIGHHARKTRP